MEKLTTKITTLITKKRVLGKFPNKKVKCLTFCVSCKSPSVIQRKPYRKAVQKPYTQPYEKQGLPYAKLYKMAQLPYDAIQKSCTVQQESHSSHTRSCTRRSKPNTVRLNCHTMPYTKPYSTAEKPYSVHT